MKRLLALSAALVWLSFLPLPALADFEAGQAAYERGDFQTAFREFKAVAEQGDASGQLES